MPKISIIVPIYNAEQYIEECIESLVHQTFKDIEIILVNDGSTDRSLEICKRYVDEDERILLINKVNEGVSRARNTGLEEAKGEYIGFVDADDWIEYNMYECMYKTIQLYEADICMCNFNEVNHKVHPVSLPLQKQVIEQSEIQTELLDRMIGKMLDKVEFIPGYTWRCLYRKELIKENKILYKEQQKIDLEDFLFNLEVMVRSRRICIDKGYYYNYRIRVNSLSREYRACMLQMYKGLRTEIEKIDKDFHILNQKNYNAFTVSLAVTMVINEIKDYKKIGILKSIKKMKAICNRKEIHQALVQHNISNINFTRKVQLVLMKHKIMLPIFCYYCYRIYKR